MARLNVYVPDELVERAREIGLNISALTQAAIAAELDRHAIDEWLAGVPVRSPHISHEAAIAALDDARTEIGSGHE